MVLGAALKNIQVVVRSVLMGYKDPLEAITGATIFLK